MKLSKKTTSTNVRRHGRRGFTLVELIVVLIILAILAAIGVGSAIGYINRSKFEKNSQYAVTVYQAAQSALTQKVSNGRIDSFASDLLTIGDVQQEIPSNPRVTDETVHITVALTYNPKLYNPQPNNDQTNDDQSGNTQERDPQSVELYGLLNDYFYEKSIFSGTIGVVFDVTITADGNGIPQHSASVIATFYSLENYSTTEHWDSVRIGGNSDEAPWNKLPNRNGAYRQGTSYVGFFDGTEASVVGSNGDGQPSGISSIVYFPAEEEVEQIDFLFTLRNAETLDVTWSLFDDTEHDAVFEIVFTNVADSTEVARIKVNEDTLLYNPNTKITGSVTASGFLSDSPNVIYERVTKGRYTSWITRRSQEGLARVQISYDGGQNYNNYVVLPITVTSVSGDKQASYPTDIQNNGYISYTLSLDAMTTRSVYNSGSVNIPHSSVSLFGSNAINISASISGTYNAGTHFGSDNTSTYYATRAVNDPVYASNPGYDLWSETVRVDGETDYVVDHIVYCYTVSNSTNTLDSDGKCVVNTMFGDVICYNTPGDSTSNQSGNVSITSFRHLSNTRLVDSSVHFWIARDLNWYVHMHTVSPNNPSDIYASEVKSFISSGIYNSPVMNTEENRANNTCLRIVSFPALHELKTGQILSALGTCSINNVQLRNASFIFNKDSGDEGYGLICKNSGTIYNIFTNNLNLVIVSVADGSPCDYNAITCDDDNGSVGSIRITSQQNGWGSIPANCDRPVGGLVGLNANSIGLEDGADAANTIRMSNTIVMANKYWTIWSNPNKNGTGGIVGKNESSVYGVLEVNGTFAVVGRDHVGGIIGWSYNDANDDFDARFRVNQTAVPANTLVEINLPAYGNADLGGDRMSCTVIAMASAGSAIGCLQGAKLDYSFNPFAYSQNPETGVFSTVETNGYQFDVRLPEDSLIYQLGAFAPRDDAEKCGAGGAIGYMRECSGDRTSIQVNNSGNIIINDVTNNMYCGGVIGREYNCTTANININVINGTGSKIGYYNTSNGPICSGGAYGQIQSESAGRTIAINVNNEGSIISRGLISASGAGGAIGGVTKKCSITFAINVTNNSNQIICVNNSENNYTNVGNWNGVGGAIGGIELDNSTLSANTIIYAFNNNSNIKGIYHVGGAVGNAPFNNGKIYAVNVSTVITGVRFVGGAVGYDRDSQYGTIQATLTDTTITGEDYVGGAAGALHYYYNNGTVATIVDGGTSYVRAIENGSGTGSLIGGVCGDIRVLNKDNTGHIGLAGNGTLTVIGGTGSTGVGGAVGVLRAKNENLICRFSLPDQIDSGLIVNVEGYNDVGGVIGQVRSSNQGYTNKMSDSLGGTLGGFSFALYDFEVVLHPASHITATGSNVGGAIGHINATKGSTYQRGISVSIANGTPSDNSGIRGISCVGGAVGRFDNSYPTLNDGSTIKVDFTAAAYSVSANPSTSGEDSNVGGAIGLLTGKTDKTFAAQYIEVNLGSSVISAVYTNASGEVIRGKNVGGAIGKTEVTNGTNALFASSISVTITGLGKIEGYNNIGGVIGYNGSVISGAVSSDISGSAVISGVQNVAGAVGWAGNRMDSVNATIACNNAIQGRNNLGGAIGNAEYGTFTIGSVTATINGVAYPILQTEELSTADDACIGGVIGFVSNNCTISNVKLNGTGGTVSLSSAQIPQILDGQVREYTGALLISGKGRSIGGVIGSIGGDSNNTKVYDISVETINICVVSTNGSQRVGGWIGSCFGRLGNSSSLTNYSVDTVKVVYSSSECVGGFCGTINQSGNTAAKLYANITVNLYGAIVTGRARVGGAFGDVYETDIESILTVNLHSETRIGDFNGNYEYGDTRGCICIDVGGAIGRFSVPSCVDSRNGLNPNKSTRVWVSIYENSMIFAGGSDDSGLEVTIDQAGVGGAFGRYGNPNTQSIYPNFADTDNTTDPYISVYCASPYTTVYSKKSIIGGAVGHMYSGTISSSYSTAAVRTDGGSAAGGFVGSCESGYVHNCYSGGHTVGGQYISQFENVIGVDNVGGIIGYVGSGVGPNIPGSNHAIQQCYSTCSVRGTTRVGGAFGWVNSSYSNMIHTVYCTGLVSSNPGSEYIGSYAGYINDLIVFNQPDTRNANKIVRANNINLDRVGNFPESLNQVTNAMIYPANWNGSGNTYIRINAASNYTAYPFDSTLGDPVSGTKTFPLRTFLSYTVGSVWHGTHYGDWPVIPNENVIDRSCIKIGDREFGDLKIDDVAYNGPVTTLPDGLIEVRFGGAGGTLLVEGRDYTISYMYNDRLSTEGYPAYVIIAGIGDPAGTSGYWGSVTIPFNIVRRDISDTDISGITITPDDPAVYTYTGSEIRPVTISLDTGMPDPYERVIPLVEGTDYTISYTDNINAGTAHVHITGIGNYTGEYDGEFTIAPRAISEATDISVAAAFYDGSELTPAVTITMTEGGEPLILGTDFTVTYTNNVEPRDKDAENPPTAHITGSGNYTGTVDVAFTIGKADIDGDTIEILIDPDTYTYTGSPIIPDPDTITITSDGVPLNRDTDYRIVSITENDSAGEASVNIEGIGDYTGTTTGHFTILDPVVTFDSNGGSTIEPESVPYGEYATVPQNPPTREGYTFAGWFISDEAEEPYDFEHTPIEDNITLKARWDRIHLTVTFNSMGGSSVDPADVLYGEHVARPADPTRDMFTFAGWYTSEAHTTLFDFENTLITADTIIYAYWTLDTSTPTPPPEPDDPVDPDPENPGNPDNPDPENPGNPDNPDPENPGNPDNPDPVEPEDPETPDPENPTVDG